MCYLHATEISRTVLATFLGVLIFPNTCGITSRITAPPSTGEAPRPQRDQRLPTLSPPVTSPQEPGAGPNVS